MEKGGGGDQNQLLDELNRALELTVQLEAHLDQPRCRSLAQTILSSVQKSILLADSTVCEKPGQPACPNVSTDSPHSTGSESSERVLHNQELSPGMPKKRKTGEKWASRVRVNTGPGGVEVPLDDSYTWRKYGQKDILGAKHPRGYYRCTHRNSHGCAATKQVQRSDEDPNVFDVTYHGTHTCFQIPKKIHKPETQERKVQQNQHECRDSNQYLHPHQDQQPILGFETGLLVKIDGLDLAHDQASSSFSFPSTPVSCVQPGSHIFSSPSIQDNCYMGSPPPYTYTSPATPTTSESNCLLVPPYQMSSYAMGLNMQASELDLTELILPATSTTNSPMVDMDFMREPEDFDLGFPFDCYDIFSRGF